MDYKKPKVKEIKKETTNKDNEISLCQRCGCGTGSSSMPG